MFDFVFNFDRLLNCVYNKSEKSVVSNTTIKDLKRVVKNAHTIEEKINMVLFRLKNGKYDFVMLSENTIIDGVLHSKMVAYCGNHFEKSCITNLVSISIPIIINREIKYNLYVNKIIKNNKIKMPDEVSKELIILLVEILQSV
jgi:hypothetical protein